MAMMRAPVLSGFRLLDDLLRDGLGRRAVPIGRAHAARAAQALGSLIEHVATLDANGAKGNPKAGRDHGQRAGFDGLRRGLHGCSC
ncbi:protein of unknown function (plasmid) [Sterolibacterium denitrificans]|uniref:Uncharacterized protein n=1 Tax=Sterolibacterium denitrificans TaxID=157592 RepID=A0A7Z7HT97_9PROT|nr:protein of unknown function [Sterolibacterium denitrificans]